MARPQIMTNDDIATAARRCVLRHGPNVALRVIAEDLGVSAPAVLKRVGCKTDLLVMALRPEAPPPLPPLDWSPLTQQARAALQSQDRAVNLRAKKALVTALLVLKHWREANAPVSVCRRMIDTEAAESDDAEKQLEVASRAIDDWLQTLIAKGDLKHDDPQGLRELLISAAESRAMHSWLFPHVHPKEPPAEWANRIVTTLLRITTDEKHEDKRR